MNRLKPALFCNGQQRATPPVAKRNVFLMTAWTQLLFSGLTE